MKKRLSFVALLMVLCILIISFVSCTNDSNNNSVSNTKSTISMNNREEIACKAVAEYINDYMARCAYTGLYSVIDYGKMKYTATAELKYDDVFDVEIDIYHYNSSNQLVGKNKSTIDASATVDEYGNVSNVEALNFISVEWSK